MNYIYSVKQTANMLSVCPDTVRRWVRNGWLPSKRLPNGRRYFDVTEVRWFARDILHTDIKEPRYSYCPTCGQMRKPE